MFKRYLAENIPFLREILSNTTRMGDFQIKISLIGDVKKLFMIYQNIFGLFFQGKS